MTEIRLKKDFSLANCCHPEPDCTITGYYSHENSIKIHRVACTNLQRVEQARLLILSWEEVLAETTLFEPDETILENLGTIDYAILAHHNTYGIDYSLVVARKTNISKTEAFERHKKLRDFGLIERVEATIVQYRKGIVNNKWIKHRNHTYYNLTRLGESYLEHNQKNNKNG